MKPSSTIFFALSMVALVVRACSVPVGTEILSVSTPLVSKLTGTPVPDPTGAVRPQQTQTAAPVATMFARLDSTARARTAILALTPTRIPEPTRTPITYPVLVTDQAFEDYSVRIYRISNTSTRFEIWRDEECVYTEEAIGIVRFWLDSESRDSEQVAPIAMGRDITGDGIPNLVLERWDTGRAYYYYIFEIGEDFRHIATLHTWGVGQADFIDLDSDSSLEFVTRDGVFVYWRTCFACSPRPEVILRYRGGVYQLASDLMYRPEPSTEDLAAYAQEVSEDNHWVYSHAPPVELWSYMLELIYTGHSDLAWQFLDMAWPPNVTGKDAFLEEFLSQLSESPYWSGLQR